VCEGVCCPLLRGRGSPTIILPGPSYAHLLLSDSEIPTFPQPQLTAYGSPTEPGLQVGCRFGVFSETRMQPVAPLSTRTGSKPLWSRSYRGTRPVLCEFPIPWDVLGNRMPLFMQCPA
jgi:hypothetical protein